MASCLSFLGGASAGIIGTFLWQQKHDVTVTKAEIAADEGVGEDIFPDLVVVHTKVGKVSECTNYNRSLYLDRLLLLPPIPKRKWMIYLMPTWNWHGGGPKAAEFWKLAHAVSRDQKNDDWIAPHVTLHSRATNLHELIKKFRKLVTELEKHAWAEILSTLQNGDNWSFDDDRAKRSPTNSNHHVLHKAKIQCPDCLRVWLQDNDDEVLCNTRTHGLHISLYSFRVKVGGEGHDNSPMDPELEKTSSYVNEDPRAAHHGLAAEGDIRYDLTRAAWTLVLMSPGRGDPEAIVPQVLSAVKLSDLASGN